MYLYLAALCRRFTTLSSRIWCSQLRLLARGSVSVWTLLAWSRCIWTRTSRPTLNTKSRHLQPSTRGWLARKFHSSSLKPTCKELGCCFYRGVVIENFLKCLRGYWKNTPLVTFHHLFAFCLFHRDILKVSDSMKVSRWNRNSSFWDVKSDTKVSCVFNCQFVKLNLFIKIKLLFTSC